ncbi:MAG: prolipoprotein diacylglyceryl transferase [Ardenticatenaceae bacterium]|nr:prolipoprotein diacylglyceryl transferase [Ardenticatenaceae bacterium]
MGALAETAAFIYHCPMTPIVGRLGPNLLYSYNILLGLGILAGLGVTAWRARRLPLPGWFDAALAGLAGGLIGGRIGFVLVQWDYFGERPSTIWHIWQGGYTYHGALLGGLLGLWLWCIWQKRSFAAYADLFAPGLALGSAFGWSACWFEGCAYGLETILGPFALAAPDEYGVFAVRYATQWLGMAWSLLTFALAWLTARRWQTGQLFWFTLGLLSAGYAALGFWRGDPAPTVKSLRLDSLINSTLVLISLFMLKFYGSRR